MTVTVNAKNITKNTPIIAAPPSKSVAHRLLILAALADKPTEIVCRGTSDDIERTTDCLNAMGAEIVRIDGSDVISVKPITAKSTEICKLNAGESGSTLRFLLPVLGVLGLTAEIKMAGRLPERPIEPLASELMRHGMKIERTSPDALTVSGRLDSGKYTIDGGISSQFISGLLFALPVIGNCEIEITGKTESLPYIEMTLDAMREFGVVPTKTSTGFKIGVEKFKSTGRKAVEGDYSGAAFILAAGALTDSGIAVGGLNPTSRQGDMKIIDKLREIGANITVGETVTARKGDLRGIEIDAVDIPDLVPILSVIASAAEGETRIVNAGRLRIKESDRLAAVSAMLRELGADVTEGDDYLTIRGGKPLKSGKVNGCRDHRIVMSAAVASLICYGEVTITDAEAISKSYPDFFDDLEKCKISVRKE